MDMFYDKNLIKYKFIYRDKRDLMLFYLCEFDGDTLKIKKKIEINRINNNDEFKKLKDEIERKNNIGKRNNKKKLSDNWYPRIVRENGKIAIYFDQDSKIARCNLNDNYLCDIELCIDPKDAYKLLDIDSSVDIDVVDKTKYFKEYFNFVKDLENVNFKDDKDRFGKYKAMKFYLLVRKILEENDIFKNKGYLVSEPNVFIEDYNVEYDFLILKNCDINKGIYDVRNVVATVELKNSPIRGDTTKYLEDEKYKKNGIDIPHIYFCGYESNYKNEGKLEKLKNINIDTKNKNNISTFVFLSFYDTKKYYIDEDINLDKIIDRLDS